GFRRLRRRALVVVVIPAAVLEDRGSLVQVGRGGHRQLGFPLAVEVGGSNCDGRLGSRRQGLVGGRAGALGNWKWFVGGWGGRARIDDGEIELSIAVQIHDGHSLRSGADVDQGRTLERAVTVAE